MKILRGTSVGAGIAVGRVFYLRHDADQIEKVTVTDTSHEHDRVARAKEEALAQLAALQAKALTEIGESEAMIFEVHQMMLEDPDYNAMIDSIIDDQHVNAEYAVDATCTDFAQRFAQMDNEYMRERAVDVRDISARLIDCLRGGHSASGPTEPSIIAAYDLTPSETIQLDKSLILAFILSGGSVTSHTAILARTMGIPAIIGLGADLTPDLEGDEVIVDGSAGELYIDPDDHARAVLAKKKAGDDERKALLQAMVGQPNVTLDGRSIDVYANIASPSEIDLVRNNDAGGIGLFRSEFIFLETKDYPSEAEQFEQYKTVVEAMHGKRVVIRTLDIGADKRIGYFELDEEENPALGVRGLRLCLERPGVFQTQLRAILRASAFGKVAIMFPMVASAWEVTAAVAAVDEAKDSLRAQGVEFDESVEVGIMIETPAAALISDSLAPMVDFFSVGTNDLTQYTLAVDRQNAAVDRFTDTHHEAVLRLIELAATNAHAHGKWIGICGELGADLTLTERFLRAGIDELSVSPPRILELRQHIREIQL
ncbi:MAG: phosphoenolpyruvate--protein phosphotransferase [Propionibacteriaceae bacterium]|jgi:phosphotransferase system enzyme I (PtsI)|nr:phosphoenolpyruvate--protein phosphotransferase [Propionibacteriaceae bacterium]